MEHLEELKNLHRIASADGTWNHSPYDLGICNGLEFALAILENRTPMFKYRPETWLEDIEIEDTPDGN